MKSFKNISQLTDDTCKLNLYGFIGTEADCISSAYFVEMLDYAAMYYKNCEVHINSGGGDVFEGIAMFNATSQSKMNITLYIDGIAASMGAIYSFSRAESYMSKYARMMLHSISGSIGGTISEMEDYISEAKKLQDTVIDIIVERTGLLKDDVTKRWFDGQDHWLSASEALELKLIKGIYDAPQIAIPEGEMNPTRLYNLFKNVLKTPETMKWENFLKKLNLRNEATEDEATAKVDEILKRATDAEADNLKLKTENATLAQKLADKEKAEGIALEAEITNTVENAVKEGRIQDAQKPNYIALLKADKTNGLAVLNALPKGKRMLDVINKGEESDDRAKWTFDEWSKKDGEGLIKMKANDNTRYQALLDNKLGKK
jgi:ATP-dependent protease ClpP protease subunit